MPLLVILFHVILGCIIATHRSCDRKPILIFSLAGKADVQCRRIAKVMKSFGGVNIAPLGCNDIAWSEAGGALRNPHATASRIRKGFDNTIGLKKGITT